MGSRTGVFSYSLLITFLLSQSSYAKRWIVENPKNTVSIQSLTGAKSVETLDLGSKKFLIVDVAGSEEAATATLTSNMLVRALAADKVYEDLEIELVGTSEVVPSTTGDAWHVDALKYDELNPAFDGTGVVVAVLDTGVDYTHKALKKSMWLNTKEVPNNKIDDDNNGLVDDYYGYNFSDKDSDPMDKQGHGTHCSGIIAAEKKVDSAARGIAPGAKIMAVRIIGSDKKGFLSSAAMAVKYAVDNGATVLSNSWRIYKDWPDYYNPEGIRLLEAAIKYADKHGAIFVAAAGNEIIDLDKETTNPIFPLSFKGLSNLVGVSSSSQDGDMKEVISNFSNYGAKSIPFVAPGGNILSTVPGGTWASMSGTSMATPIVAGTIARGLSKGYKSKEAINELQKTSDKSNYWQEYVEHGRIDVEKYLQ